MDECSCHLAVSLHNPFPEERAELMPMEKPFPLAKTLSLIRGVTISQGRGASASSTSCLPESMMTSVMPMLWPGCCAVWNAGSTSSAFTGIPDSPLAPSPMPVIEQFKARLNNAGVLTTLRASRGGGHPGRLRYAQRQRPETIE